MEKGINKRLAVITVLIIIFTVLPMGKQFITSFSIKDDTLVVFSTASLPDSFMEFKNLKESEGLNVIVITPQELQGEDKVVSLRDYLRDRLKTLNIKYLMIIGSDSKFPMVRFYPRGDGRSDEFDGYFEPTPSDIFFACLNEEFDKDGDGKLGEYPDDNIHVKPEIFVGRIPIDDKEELDRYFSSLVRFEKLPFSRKNKALLAGAYLSFRGKEWMGRTLKTEDGAEFMEKIIDEILVKNRITPIRLYEDEGTLPSAFLHDFPLNTVNLQKLLSEETFSLISINAHGSPYSVARYIWNDRDGDYTLSESETTFKSLLSTGTLPDEINGGIVFAASCLTATPEAPNSLAKTFLSKGGSAYIGATRISWGPSYWKDIEDGGLLTIDYLFTRNFIKENQTVGEAFWNAISEYHENYFESDKEDPVEAAQMNTYTFNLFGDPTLKIDKDGNAPFMKRYSVFGFKKDNEFVPVEVPTGANIEPFDRVDGGFLIKNIGAGEYNFSVNNIPMSFNFNEIESPVYIYPEERKHELYLHIFGDKKIVIHLSHGLKFKECMTKGVKFYYDSYRNILLVEGGGVMIFNISNEDYSFSVNTGDAIVFNPDGLDYNHDFIINEEDIFVFAHHFGIKKEDAMYNSLFDLDKNGLIDGEDLIELSFHYGELGRQQ